MFLSKYQVIENYFPITKKNLTNYFKEKVFFKDAKNTKGLYINFIITSKTEIRIFTPLLNYILENNPEIKVSLFFAKQNLAFDSKLSKKITESKNVNYDSSPFNLIKFKKSVNVVCLDHTFYIKAHKLGIEIIDFLNRENLKTVCIQHGGNQDDYIKGQLSSKSKYQIVFGKLIFNRLLEYGFGSGKVYLTGNPLHDNLFSSNSNLKLDENRKVISLVTCMHTEYDDRPDPKACYIEYLKNVYTSINFDDYQLVVKMHPYDNVLDNIYDVVSQDLKLADYDVRIIKSNDSNNSVYDIISASDIVISRASTIIEEALMINKRVIAFDLFEDGNSKYYDFLLKYKKYEKVIGKAGNLRDIIAKSSIEAEDNLGDIDELVLNTTYKLDGKSTERIIRALKDISKIN